MDVNRTLACIIIRLKRLPYHNQLRIPAFTRHDITKSNMYKRFFSSISIEFLAHHIYRDTYLLISDEVLHISVMIYVFRIYRTHGRPCIHKRTEIAIDATKFTYGTLRD